MADLDTLHEEHGAVVTERGGRQVVERYRRPSRTHLAVRNGVGVREMPYGVLVVEGDDRVPYVDDVLTNRVPEREGEGCYALLLDPQGGVESDLYVYNAGERLLLFTPPGRADGIADDWEVFIEDVKFEVATESFHVFGVHGPKATEKLASVFTGGSTPDEHLSFARGSIGEAGVTVVRTDAPLGEEGYEVIASDGDGGEVFDALLNYGLNAVPFGREVWEALTLEAGTPLFETELEGNIPNELGLRDALDFEKGCYVGQEVVSRIENRGHPGKRLVGLSLDADSDGGDDATLPDSGAAVFEGDAAVGEVTRAAEAPKTGRIAFALVDFAAGSDLSVRVAGEEVPAPTVELPFAEGSDVSARIPRYE